MWKVGIIGLGSFGQKRLKALLELPGLVKSIVLFDSDSERVTTSLKFSVSPSIQVTTAPSLREFFSSPALDAVFVCTPNSTHAELCTLSLEHEKHVLCEKPITSNISVAKSLIALSQKKSKLLRFGMNHRFFPSIEKMISLVQAGKIGKVLSFHATIGTDGQRIQSTWFWKKDIAEGGTFIDNGHHLMDLAAFCCGSFSECIGYSSKRVWTAAEVEDYGVAIYSQPATTHSVGYEAVLRSSWRQPEGYLDVEIWGTEGWIKVSAAEEEELHWKHSGPAKKYSFSDFSKDSLQQDTKNFFRQCLSEELIEQQAAHLLSVTSMISSFYSSIEKNQSQKIAI